MKQPSAKLWDLMEAVVEDQATEQQVHSLNSLLEEDADARLSYVTFMDMHAQILWSLRGLKDTEEQKPSPSRTKWMWISLIALCAIVLNVSIIYWFIPSATSSHGILLEGEGFVWAGESKLIPGQQLTEEKKQLLAGVVRIDAGKSANILIEAPATFAVNEHSLLLDRGRIVVRAYKADSDFIIETPAGKIFSANSSFAVSVSPGEMQLHVFEGMARLEKMDVVKAGHSLIVRGDSSTAARADFELFLHSITGWQLDLSDNYARQVMGDKPVHYWRFDSLKGEMARNSASETAARVRGRRASIQIMSGTPNRILKLNYMGTGPDTCLVADNAMQSLLQENKNFSIEFWFNAALISRGTLLHSGRSFTVSLEPGRDRSGLSLHCVLSSSDGNKVELSSGEAFGIKRWYHAVIARNDSNIALYINGKQVDSIKPEAGFTPAFDDMLVTGAYLDSKAKKVSIPFRGRFDELALYGHCLSPERIKSHFQAAHISR